MSQDLSLEAIAHHCVKGHPKRPGENGKKAQPAHKPYEKHVLGRNADGNRIPDTKDKSRFRQNEFRKLGIKTREQYRDHIIKTLNDPKTKAFKSTGGRNIYYNKKTNTYIAQNNKDPGKCTCFRPTNKQEYFKDRVEKACRERHISYEKGKQEIKKGGYHALYPKKELKSEKKLETDKERRSRQAEEHIKRQAAQRQKGKER